MTTTNSFVELAKKEQDPYLKKIWEHFAEYDYLGL